MLAAGWVVVDRVPAGAPRGDALDEPARAVPAPAKQLDCRDRQDAVWAPAVGHDLLAFRKLVETVRQLGHGQRKRARDVPGGKLVSRPDVDERHIACVQTAAWMERSMSCMPLTSSSSLSPKCV
jgi:hypothetical protein